MSDLISRQAAIKTAHFPTIDDAGYEVVRVDDILALSPTEPKTGTWKEEYAGNGWNDFWDFTCSECGREFHKFYKSNFCPNCGAKMRGEEE